MGINKSIKLSKNNLDYLHKLKREYNFKTINDVLDVILVFAKDGIKKKDFKLINQNEE